jgi:hypothetical protein
MNIFPKEATKNIKTIGIVIIILLVLASIYRNQNIIDIIINTLIWWSILWVVIKIFNSKKEISNNEKELVKLRPNSFIKKEGIFSVTDFFTEATLNSIRAKHKYEGKKIKIQGLIRDIYEDGNFFIGYALHVVLSELDETGEEFDKFTAKFSLGKRKSISSLNIGDHIIISGSIQDFEKGKVNMYSSSIEK